MGLDRLDCETVSGKKVWTGELLGCDSRSKHETPETWIVSKLITVGTVHWAVA